MDTHDHPHDHTRVAEKSDVMPGYYEIMETAVRELLIEKKLITAPKAGQIT